MSFFLFAFITFNPCFTAWVCHGVFTVCFLLLIYITYALSWLHLLSDLILLCLIFLELILKLFEGGSQEACGADGVYMVLKKQRRWDRFECRWAVGLQQAVGRCGSQWRTQELFSGVGGSTNSVEVRGQRGRGSGGGSPLVRGSGGSCNLVQEISFHIVKVS